jgi:peptidoglycan-associated lipoprotein
MKLNNAISRVWSPPVTLLSLVMLATLVSGCARKAQQDDTTSNQTTGDDTTSQSDTVAGDDSLEEGAHSAANGGRCELQPVFFAYDQAALDSDARAQLVSNARCINSTSPARVAVEGMTDDRGTTEYNLSLGDRRAHVAAAFVVAQGVSSSVLRIRSVGEELATGNDERTWARDRRAEFNIE